MFYFSVGLGRAQKAKLILWKPPGMCVVLQVFCYTDLKSHLGNLPLFGEAFHVLQSLHLEELP